MVAPPLPPPPGAFDRLPGRLVLTLVDASLRLDLVEPLPSTLRADEPAHRTVAVPRGAPVVVRPGWGGRVVAR
jgi:hypothetical protein